MQWRGTILVCSIILIGMIVNKKLLLTTINEIIKKVGKKKWRLYSKDMSRNLGTFNSRAGAEKHEREVQYFKHKNDEQVDGSIKLSELLFNVEKE